MVWIFFLFLDCLDGDLARIAKTNSHNGQVIDSFGADIFYFFFPIATSYNILNSEHYNNVFGIQNFIFIGISITFLLIMHRILQTKTLNLLNNINLKRIKKIKKNNLLFNKIFNLVNNEYIRGNFFAEPGMILVFFILSFLQNYYLLEIYLYILLIYFFIRFLISLLKLFIMEKK